MLLDGTDPKCTRVHINGTEIATYQFGPPPGEADGEVVFCHGTPWSAASWMPVARVLADRYRVFLWDMPGYGSSITEPAPAVDLIHQRQRLASLIDYWNLDQPHVLAHDVGGAVALGAHLFEDSEFDSLYLVDIVTLEPWGSPFFRLVAQHEDVFSALPLNLHDALVREYISSAGSNPLDPAWINELASPWSSAEGQRAFYRQIAQLSPIHTRPIVEHLDQVRCRTRIGWGGQDQWIPVGQAAELADRLPADVGIVTFPAAGHLVPVEFTEELSTDALGWFTGENWR
ncbi:alpha/beta fold hydrolase [Citricoccus sp. GCM10030269]|uniref:alpha/beta fold hydrolase n=1 Tax=Citricoccus sp. GCM10030269 TaxID=3273388 RepID=UPI003613B280